jgi:hypothetical protein
MSIASRVRVLKIDVEGHILERTPTEVFPNWRCCSVYAGGLPVVKPAAGSSKAYPTLAGAPRGS